MEWLVRMTNPYLIKTYKSLLFLYLGDLMLKKFWTFIKGISLKLWNSTKKLFKMLFEIVKNMWTIKGVISLLISFMIYYGWIVVLYWIGFAESDAALIAIATAAVAFWAGPFTPFIPIWITTAYFIQKYILRDEKAKKFEAQKIE